MTEPFLAVNDVAVSFTSRNARHHTTLQAVRGVSLEIGRCETLAVVGESGSGKSTLARAVLRLVRLTHGRITLDGQDITDLRGRALRDTRRHMQMIFQDPYSSLDPSSIVSNVIAEPLKVHTDLDSGARRARVGELLDQVGLPATAMERYPYEFSGGQRQRIAIARALAVNPQLVVLDEAVSALDVSTQNQILQLLERLKIERGLSYLFISHNLAVVRWIADRTAVMYLGSIVELGPTARVHHAPAHPYTVSLLSAMPVPDPVIQRKRHRIPVLEDPPDPTQTFVGCAFRQRCPRAIDICEHVAPPLVEVPGGGWAACHLLVGNAHPPTSNKHPSTVTTAEEARQ